MGRQLGNLRLCLPERAGRRNDGHPDVQYRGGDNIQVVAAEFEASPIPPNACAVWSAQYPTADTTDPSSDNDMGGLPAGIERVLGGNPTTGADDAGLAPSFDNTSDPSGKFLFTFRRSNTASLDPNTTMTVEYGNALTGWTAAIHQGTGANRITISGLPDGSGFSRITVALPGFPAPGGKLFARLRVLVAQP